MSFGLQLSYLPLIRFFFFTFFIFSFASEYLNCFSQDDFTLTYDDRKLAMQYFPSSLFLAILDWGGNNYLNASHYVFLIRKVSGCWLTQAKVRLERCRAVLFYGISIYGISSGGHGMPT